MERTNSSLSTLSAEEDGRAVVVGCAQIRPLGTRYISLSGLVTARSSGRFHSRIQSSSLPALTLDMMATILLRLTPRSLRTQQHAALRS